MRNVLENLVFLGLLVMPILLILSASFAIEYAPVRYQFAFILSVAGMVAIFSLAKLLDE